MEETRKRMDGDAGLDADDWDRIREFCSADRARRLPEILVPDGSE